MIWFLTNIVVPFSSMIAKYIIVTFARPEAIHVNLFEINELLSLSTYYCIISINILYENNSSYKLHDSNTIILVLLRIILIVIIILNFIFLAMYYSNSLGDFIWSYLRVVIPVNIFIPIYLKVILKIKYT